MHNNKGNDETLWCAARDGDAQAFAALFDRYWSKLYSTAFHYLKDKEAASDVVHDLFLNLWLKRSHLEINSFSHYLTAAARYAVYKRLKARNNLRVVYTEGLVDQHSELAHNEGLRKLQTQELGRQVELLLEGLPTRCKEIFLLSRRELLSNDEIARRLQISKRTVENQLTTALKHLRPSLKHLHLLLLLASKLY